MADSSPSLFARLSRRDFARTLALGAAATALPRLAWAQSATTPAGAAARMLPLEDSEAHVRLVDGSVADRKVAVLERQWSGGSCRARLANRGTAPLVIREIVLASAPHAFGQDTSLYGESFQMLSQTAGTLGQPKHVAYSEKEHYKLPEVPDAATVRSFALLSPTSTARHLVGFASCRRFSGELRIFAARLEAVLDTEGRTLGPGETWELEELVHFIDVDREALLDRLAGRVTANHPRLSFPQLPTGWCSWYFYGKRLSEDDILQNLDAIAADKIPLDYIQIDDGYQPAHGDWLDENPKFFPRGIKALCHTIRDRGFRPAIWVAPFIAAPNSRLLREHPDWFVQGDDGQPLSAEKVTFRGWNNAPWYMLDATQPVVQAHLENVFRTMRQEWGVTYFKLDANFWGAVQGSSYADPHATRIENYRRGMAAIIRGAGPDSFLLGCNAPMWASLGLVHGQRVTGDIKRDWSKFTRCARELFYRNWQHGRLWINDPDCIVVSKRIRGGNAEVTDDELGFHAAAILASGGMTLNGDDYTGLTAAQKAMLRKTLPPTNAPARFTTDDFREGRASLPEGRELIFVFNWDDQPRNHTVLLNSSRVLRDFWSDADLGARSRLELSLAPHSARVVVATRA